MSYMVAAAETTVAAAVPRQQWQIVAVALAGRSVAVAVVVAVKKEEEAKERKILRANCKGSRTVLSKHKRDGDCIRMNGCRGSIVHVREGSS